MAITSVQQVLDALPGQSFTFMKILGNIAGPGLYASSWTVTGYPPAGATPATGAGAVPTSATTGAVAFANASSGSLYLAKVVAAAVGSNGTLVFYDRLVHTSGLDGTSTSAQTVNSTALTRYTSGAGVELWLEPYTSLGSTSVTATISYTNSAGTASRTGTITVPTSWTAGRMLPAQLQAGDVGVQSVQTVTLSATTGTVGNFGITLVRRLVTIRTDWLAPLLADAVSLALPLVQPDACIALMWVLSTGGTTNIGGEFELIQG